MRKSGITGPKPNTLLSASVCIVLLAYSYSRRMPISCFIGDSSPQLVMFVIACVRACVRPSQNIYIYVCVMFMLQYCIHMAGVHIICLSSSQKHTQLHVCCVVMKWHARSPPTGFNWDSMISFRVLLVQECSSSNLELRKIDFVNIKSHKYQTESSCHITKFWRQGPEPKLWGPENAVVWVRGPEREGSELSVEIKSAIIEPREGGG